MSQAVTLNAVGYTIPDPNDTGWGQNLTNYLVAIPAAVFQKTGGTFALTAEADFGASFGFKSAYLKTRTVNIAASGFIRMANNSDAISWRNAANNADLALQVNASNLLTFNAATVYTLLAGTLVNADIASAAAIAVNKLAAVTPSRALLSDASGFVSAGTTTAGEIGFLSGVTSGVQGQLNTKAPLASPTFTGTVTAPTINATTLLTGKGTVTNDNATAGNIGETVTGTTGTVSVPTSAQWGNNASVVLTAGDWLISYFLDFVPNGATVTAGNSGIGTVTGNDSTGVTNGDSGTNLNIPSGSIGAGSTSLPFWRASISGTTTYYLKITATYTVATPQYRGRITAVRIR